MHIYGKSAMARPTIAGFWGNGLIGGATGLSRKQMRGQMTSLGRVVNIGIAAGLGCGLGFGFGPAPAQTIIDAGKTPPQLFASDCSVCHKTPQGLAKSGPIFLQSFLRQHYTASRETAQALADYLGSLAEGAPAKPPVRASKPREAKKPADGRPSDGKPADAKATEAKASAAKTGNGKPADIKPAEAKPAEATPADAKPAEPKPAEAAPAKSE